jgi:hypothetical protein
MGGREWKQHWEESIDGRLGVGAVLGEVNGREAGSGISTGRSQYMRGWEWEQRWEESIDGGLGMGAVLRGVNRREAGSASSARRRQ